MTAFGDALAAVRRSHGLSQQGLSDAIDNRLSRSTIAGIESGHQVPSERLRRLLETKFPNDWPVLRPLYEQERQRQADLQTARRPPSATRPSQPLDKTSMVLGGAFVIEDYQLIYNFRESKSPEEIIELRRVRARRAGAHNFRVSFIQEDSTGFVIEPEVLFGGTLTENDRTTARDRTIYAQRVEFDQPLRKNQTHVFGLRYWVQHDPVPANFIVIEMTNLTESVTVHANFWGQQQPHRAWRFGPLTDAILAPAQPTRNNGIPLLFGRATARFIRPELSTTFGLAWEW